MLRRRGAFSVEPLRGLDGPWETAESCVVRTSASVYRRLHESPRSPPAGMSGEESGSWGPPQPLPAPGSPQASGRLLKSESEDSGVEMASNENSPSTPLGSESSFSLDGFQQPAHGDPPKSPPGGERGAEPPRPFRSRSASRKPGQQRSRRQRQLSRRSTSAGDPRELSAEEPETTGVDAAVPGQGLRYLEHICQMLERVARLQQDNRLLRQQAAGARRAGSVPHREQEPATWRGERFRARSCSDSHAPAPDPTPCRRRWVHSASSPSLLEPSESGSGTPSPDKDGRSHWGRVKVLLTRLARRSLRGGRCR
ncbi:uncharacterized protein C8orf58 homolog isoform X2 [Anas platyrhynchos]|uniref:uncharacterized protein C8orf58 homolog isoform X2 n=1 Tax=Anas platyrhynchos TaxID=8839 RepID=UPI003AF20E36